MLCCGSRSRPIETMAECLGDDCRCRRVVPAFASMNISEEFKPLVLLHTPLENSGCTSVNQLVVDAGVCTRSALNSPSFIFFGRKYSIHQKISDRLCPHWGTDDHHEHCLLGYDCFFDL